MKLRDLIRDVPARATSGNLDVDISMVTADSRLVRKGALFVAIPGTQKDGTQFVGQAIEKGAAAVVVSRAPLPAMADATPTVEVEDPRAALALIAANFYGHPADKLSLVGVTGTSGKTTTTKMIESVFDAAGGPVGLIGTIEYRAGYERLVADRTTPDSVVLHEWFAKMVDAGVRHAVMEVSSHALALKRTYGIRFAAGVFTNLSQVHFDFHKDFEHYYRAKRILFDQIDRSRRTAIVNIDDEYGRRLARELGPDTVLSFGEKGDVRPANDFIIDVRGLRGRVITPAGDVRVESRLLGAPDLSNLLAAIGAGISVGIATGTIEKGIRALQTVRGRFETVSGDHGPTVIVDYAHKPDALEKLLHAVRNLAGRRRVVVLFGCGGDRDRDKRPKMAAIATKLADFTILTSDNPRGEKPDAIIDEIEKGMAGVPPARYRRVTDRREAIARTIADAGDDDVIVIAGKGHEKVQITLHGSQPFDDVEVARKALESVMRSRPQTKRSGNASA